MSQDKDNNSSLSIPVPVADSYHKRLTVDPRSFISGNNLGQLGDTKGSSKNVTQNLN